jgi:hypothetical protein
MKLQEFLSEKLDSAGVGQEYLHNFIVIMEAMLNHFELLPTDYWDKELSRKLVKPRQVLYWLLKNYTNISHEKIGHILNKNKQVVYFSCDEIDNYIENSDSFNEKITSIVKEIKPKLDKMENKQLKERQVIIDLHLEEIKRVLDTKVRQNKVWRKWCFDRTIELSGKDQMSAVINHSIEPFSLKVAKRKTGDLEIQIKKK